MRAATLDGIVDDLDASDDDRALATLLIAACTDWPAMGLTEPADLVSALSHEIAAKLTLAQMTHYASSLEPAADAWKMESMESVIAFLHQSIDMGLPEQVELGDAIACLGRRHA